MAHDDAVTIDIEGLDFEEDVEICENEPKVEDSGPNFLSYVNSSLNVSFYFISRTEEGPRAKKALKMPFSPSIL